MTHLFRRAEVRRAGKERGSEADFAQRLVTNLDPTSPVSEAYRTLRTNLLYTLVDEPPKVIVLTSSGPGEGKSTTCANLGVVLAQASKSVLILDCDFRRPIMHKIFGLRNVHGIIKRPDRRTRPARGLEGASGGTEGGPCRSHTAQPGRGSRHPALFDVCC